MIWVIGGKGMLGREICGILEEKKLEYTATDKELSILDLTALQAFAEEQQPGWIINASGYTAVDKAEGDKKTAFAINRDGVAHIARATRGVDIPVIHISTDYVFDGSSAAALDENASVDPIGVYGKSKLAGEEELRRIQPRHFIIRTAWLYGEYGGNFVSTMIKLMNKRDEIRVVSDQIGSPTWTWDLASLLGRIISTEGPGGGQYGTYHYSNEGECSWYDFAQAIYRNSRELGLVKSPCRVNPCTSEDFPTPARRPQFSLLSKDKVKGTFGVRIPSWEESLVKYLKNIKESA